MKARLSTLNLLMHAYNNPESAVADALDGILDPGRRKHAGATSALVDWMTAGDDLSSIIAFSLPHDDTPDKSALPLWPLGTVR
ncbi:hypothetical protein GPL21_30845 [Bradyrhizobium pachyrhizi]|uniref:Uncharacterized protein n=1 Tax=Bradyrhizobium pachyrhizi TaxID=280333 RepID=A0A844T338_9BRAD|nr:hypothetical protein [Bradyrhizobium pachyrhizi]MVT69491.1 hypothetical protein [Bradyrhizobium pachyrhizi]